MSELQLPEGFTQTARGVSPVPPPGAERDEIIEAVEIVHGNPTAEEAAAITAVMTGLAAEWAETKHRKKLG